MNPHCFAINTFFPRGQRLLWAGCNQTPLKLSSQRQYIYFFIDIRLPRVFNHLSISTTVTGWACHQNALMIKGKRCPGDWKKNLFHWRQLRITHYSFCSFRNLWSFERLGLWLTERSAWEARLKSAFWKWRSSLTAFLSSTETYAMWDQESTSQTQTIAYW